MNTLKDFFKPNWYAINKAIPDNLKELRQAQKEIEMKIQKKVNDYYKKEKEIEIAEKISELKSMPVNSDLYYIGHGDKIKFGAKGSKIEDKRTRMLIEFNGTIWNCPYVFLINRLPTEHEIRNRKIENDFIKIISSFSKKT